MGEMVSGGQSGLLGLLHGQGGGIGVPKPFEREIFLFDTHVAGTTHIDGIEELEPRLSIGDKLRFFREPDNPHDSKAIVIKTDDGAKVGYVPQADNPVFARLMDAGKLLYGRISEKEMRGKWLKMDIQIYLHE